MNSDVKNNQAKNWPEFLIGPLGPQHADAEASTTILYCFCSRPKRMNDDSCFLWTNHLHQHKAPSTLCPCVRMTCVSCVQSPCKTCTTITTHSLSPSSLLQVSFYLLLPTCLKLIYVTDDAALPSEWACTASSMHSLCPLPYCLVHIIFILNVIIR